MNIKKISMLLVLGAVWGCSSSGGGSGGSGGAGAGPTGGGSIAQFCQQACNKVQQCDATADTQTCTAGCQNGYAVSGPKLRSDFVSGMTSCFTAKDCATVLSGSAESQCADEAAAALAPTATGSAFCNELESAANKCGGSVEKAGCLEAAKQYSDAALSAAQSCLSKA